MPQRTQGTNAPNGKTKMSQNDNSNTKGKTNEEKNNGVLQSVDWKVLEQTKMPRLTVQFTRLGPMVIFRTRTTVDRENRAYTYTAAASSANLASAFYQSLHPTTTTTVSPQVTFPFDRTLLSRLAGAAALAESWGTLDYDTSACTVTIDNDESFGRLKEYYDALSKKYGCVILAVPKTDAHRDSLRTAFADGGVFAGIKVTTLEKKTVNVFTKDETVEKAYHIPVEGVTDALDIIKNLQQ